MQFAGQRAGLDLEPIGEPDNFLIKLTEDVLPEPEAILVHGITPQRTRAEGISEAEAAKFLTSQVFTPDTITVGFNNIRFDDEFIHYLFWRNFTDAYEWQWKDGRSRWDLLDVARMTRALRPDGIKWPFAPDGKPSNRLELLSSVNGLDHAKAHDALSDVHAMTGVAKLLRSKQPKLFDYLLNLRDKRKVEVLVMRGEPFVYTSGRYESELEKTTVAVVLGPYPERGAALVYNLRVDPDDFTTLKPDKLAQKWNLRGKDVPYFPVKTLSFNRCPAVAPLSVLDAASASRLKIDSAVVDANLAKLKKAQDFTDKVIRALEINKPNQQPELVVNEFKVDGQLYDGFVNDADKTKMRVVRAAGQDQLADLQLNFADDRLEVLLPLYKARNYPASLNDDEKTRWENFRNHALTDGGVNSRMSRFFKKLKEISERPMPDSNTKFILEELSLYAQSLTPEV